MRFNITIEHGERKKAWEEAYVRHNAFAEAGNDGAETGGTAESDDASKAEYVTLEAFISSPSTTTVEMMEKLEVMLQRDIIGSTWSIADDVLSQMKRDLMNLSRPNASPAVAAAFADWADSWAHWHGLSEANDDENDRRNAVNTQAERALMDLPCTTAGDFIVKAYIEMMRETCAVAEGLGFFVPDKASLHPHDERVWNDIRQSDLGCCMLALGRVDFDAARWVAACRRHDKGVTLMRSEKGSGLSLDMTGPHNIMTDTLQRLTANGLRVVSSDRCGAIAKEIEAHHPDLVIDFRNAIAA